MVTFVFQQVNENTDGKELLRAMRGSSGTTYGIALKLRLKLYDETQVTHFVGTTLGMNGNEDVATYALRAPRNVIFFYENSLLPGIGYRTYISAACFGSRSLCQRLLNPIKIGRGRYDYYPTYADWAREFLGRYRANDFSVMFNLITNMLNF